MNLERPRSGRIVYDARFKNKRTEREPSQFGSSREHSSRDKCSSSMITRVVREPKPSKVARSLPAQFSLMCYYRDLYIKYDVDVECSKSRINSAVADCFANNRRYKIYKYRYCNQMINLIVHVISIMFCFCFCFLSCICSLLIVFLRVQYIIFRICAM